MPVILRHLKAVVFDYGNTLIEFAAPQIGRCDRALAAALARRLGPVDFDALHAVRNEDRMAPYSGNPPAYRENDMSGITTRLVERLYGAPPAPDLLAALLRCRADSFVAAVEASPYVAPLLRELRGRYRLGVLSNYPDAPALRASIERTGLAPLLDAVVVSADLGRVKPHPAVFAAILERMGVASGEALLVGDNWLGDVQGAKRAGLQAVLTTQYDTPERLPRRPGDAEPDAVIGHLEELRALLLP